MWIPITYRDFHDIPRAFVAEFEGRAYLFDCPFDEELDDYPHSYTVYRFEAGDRPWERQSWEALRDVATAIGSVAVSSVEFDETRRRAVHAGVFSHAPGLG